MIAVEVNDAAVIADLDGMSSKVMRGSVRAMNRAIQSGKAEMKRTIAADTDLAVGVVADAMPLSKATYERAEAAFRATLKRIPLIDFKARGPEPSKGRGRGVSYLLGKGRSVRPNAFIAQMRSGHKGVFTRSGKAGIRTGRIIGWRKSPKAWSYNLPIHELYGPSLGHVFAKHRPLGIARTKEAFDVAFAHELDRLISGAPEGGGDA